MSETSNGMPDLSTGDSEPSMEDILASIRKIIADDKTESPEFEAEAEDLLSPTTEADNQPSSFSEQVDEQQFEIPEVEGSRQEVDAFVPDTVETPEIPRDVEETAQFEDEEILDLINFAENEIVEEDTSVEKAIEGIATTEDVQSPSEPVIVEEHSSLSGIETAADDVETSFDESLDLVMDSDATDYYTQSAESDENRLLREEIENDLNIEVESFEPAVPPAFDADLVTTADDLPAAPDLEDLLETDTDEHQDILSLDEEQVQEVFSNLADEETEVPVDEGPVEAAIETVEEAPDIDLNVEEFTPTAIADEVSDSDEDQDMDLVKSLLADLMDEPEEGADYDDDMSMEVDEESGDGFIDDSAEAENILDEILYQSMKDEDAIADSVEDEAIEEESELAQIARNARAAAATPYQKTQAINPEDKVVLPDRDLGTKLNLSAAGGFVGVAAGAAIGSAAKDDGSDDLDAQVSQMVEEEMELEEIEELLELIEETETTETEDEQSDADQAALEALVEEMESPQEEENMGRAAKNEALLDEDIEQDSSDAFAALSHVVQEKAEMEENGPAIGDLVQDALRPMLKEWLDKNLKGIVERAVTKEVKRISSGK